MRWEISSFLKETDLTEKETQLSPNARYKDTSLCCWRGSLS